MQTGVVRKRRMRQVSEYGRQLQEKQELKRQYNLRERQFKNYITGVLQKTGKENAAELLMRSLESRLDSMVFRMGVAETRSEAKQMVSHGHFLVNKRRVDIPSFILKKGDVITLRPASFEKLLFKHSQMKLKKYEAPTWLKLDKEKIEAEVVGEAKLEEVAPTVEIPLIFEFYSR